MAGYFRGAASWALAWVMTGLFGWTFGSILQVFVPMLTLPNYNPADPTVFDVLALSSPWAIMSAGHAAILVAFSSGIRTWLAAALALAWLAAGTVGGIALTAALFFLDERFFGTLVEALGLGEFGYAYLGYPVLVAALYGVPTGWSWPGAGSPDATPVRG